ncbi:dihydrolipoamide acetyltransferase family protein [Gracilinema caldarium]|uniref:Dihydrolipoamide acetyltransferase component of pyruvate dehydrogenase complex n=1 Tax=Gracilinema caldarium (strain ATCC 51460 / DSM 7334 / H1) TaxID=744872 RepID=F8EXU6_GRAC1|nr:dihydrolipoamide acetyltransferase family protein [Gracilinema caldarium]AEJ20110.1 Dihydrolipoyllysine-residue acetyltransferase [Gracilinema caldarium DSM 7334]
MAHIVIMPRQGNTVESCIIVGWNKKEGDEVLEDTPLCDVETDKATFEVVAGAKGTLLKTLHEAGDDVPVLQPIAIIGEAGEDWQTILANAQGITEKTIADQETLNTEQPIDGSMPVSPRARNLAARAALDLTGVSGTGPGGRIIERDVQSILEYRQPLTAAARAAVAEGGTADLLPTEGSGIGSRIRTADLKTGLAEGGMHDQNSTEKTQEPQAMGAVIRGGAASAITEEPIKGIRKLIADRMLESLSSTAQFTLNSHARVDRMLDLRQRFKTSQPDLGLSGITLNDLVLFMVSRILPLYPFMNAHKNDDTLITYKQVHLGMAVDTPRGLMVPVIRNADQLSLVQISAEAKRLASACQQGTITPDELSGSTFTVTNLGNLGIESFTPVINIPEVAILGVCGVELKPLAQAGTLNGALEPSEIQFVPHIGLSLTINHQVVDGAPAARFLKALCDGISQVDLWLAR